MFLFGSSLFGVGRVFVVSQSILSSICPPFFLSLSLSLPAPRQEVWVRSTLLPGLEGCSRWQAARPIARSLALHLLLLALQDVARAHDVALQAAVGDLVAVVQQLLHGVGGHGLHLRRVLLAEAGQQPAALALRLAVHAARGRRRER